MLWQVVRPSVCPPLCMSVTLPYLDHIAFELKKIIARKVAYDLATGWQRISDLLQEDCPGIQVEMWNMRCGR